MKFKLIDEWNWVIHNAWSFRFMVLAGVLSGAEMIIPIFMDNPPVPRGLFAAISFIISVGACISRLVAQEKAEK